MELQLTPTTNNVIVYMYLKNVSDKKYEIYQISVLTFHGNNNFKIKVQRGESPKMSN